MQITGPLFRRYQESPDYGAGTESGSEGERKVVDNRQQLPSQTFPNKPEDGTIYQLRIMQQGALTKAVARARGCCVALAAAISIIRGEGGALIGIEIATKKSNPCSEHELRYR